jgi:hypothetical protein
VRWGIEDLQCEQVDLRVATINQHVAVWRPVIHVPNRDFETRNLVFPDGHAPYDIYIIRTPQGSISYELGALMRKVRTANAESGLQGGAGVHKLVKPDVQLSLGGNRSRDLPDHLV